MLKLKKLNLVFGLLLFISFLATGYYMKTYFKPEHVDMPVMRMQIRANHIYILLMALLNVISFKSNFEYTKYLEIGFRVLLVVSGILAVMAFFIEHSGDLDKRSYTLYSIILSVAAVGFFLLDELMSWKKMK